MISDIKQFNGAPLPAMLTFVEYVVTRNRDAGFRERKKFKEKHDKKVKELETRVAALEKEKELFQDYAKLRFQIEPLVYP
jgi:hypothetical protein